MLKKLLTISLSLSLLGAIVGCNVSSPSTAPKPSPTASPSPTATATPNTEPTTTPTAASTTKPTTGAVDYKSLIDEFKAEFDKEAKTPQGAIKMLFKALLKAEEDDKLAEYLLSVVVRADEIYTDPKSPSGYDIGNSLRYHIARMKAQPQIIRSYVGAKPDDNYQTFDKNNIVIDFPADGSVTGGVKIDNTIKTGDEADGRIYVKSSGKDIATPIYMTKNKAGLWKINSSSISSISTGVKAGGADKDI